MLQISALFFLTREPVIKNLPVSKVPVSHAYNPSYSGGRDQEDTGPSPAWANKVMRPYFENTQHENGLAEQ
jgi:hypothetical protein